MNIFRGVYKIERNGRVFLLHWKNRYDPTVAMMAMQVAGTGAQVAGTLQQGRQVNDIAKQRAAVDLMQADAVEKAAREEAQNRSEKTRRLLASQRSAAAASGIRINEGVSLVVAADTRRLAARETGFMLDRADVEAQGFRQSAAIEKAYGKQAKKHARFSALMQGLQGATTVAKMGYDAGMFSGSGTKIPINHRLYREAQARRKNPWETGW